MHILDRREYLGHTILGKTSRDNFKTKRKRIVNEEEQYIFYDTHEAIIDQETYDKAQRMRKRAAPRRNADKPTHRLSGLLYCSDCGSRLAYINANPRDGKEYDSNQAFRCSRYHNKYHSCTGHYIKASTVESLICQATKRICKHVLTDEKDFVEQLKAQYELQCEKDNTDDKKELLESKRRMMDLDDLIKGLYENFTLGRLPERQFNRLMKEYDTEQGSLEQRITELETATARTSAKTVQIDRFVRLVKKYRDFEELTTPMLNDFIEKVVVHEAEGGRTKDRTQQVDIYFNFIGNIVLPLSEEEMKAMQAEEAIKEKELAEKKKQASKRSAQRRNRKRAEIKARAEAGDIEAIAEYEAILEKGRQGNRKRAEKMNAVNNINSSKKIIERITQIATYGGNFHYVKTANDMFSSNLMMIDSRMEEIIAEMLLYHYSTGTKNCVDVVKHIETTNPIGYPREGLYTYKFKKFLCAKALGMDPSKEWGGMEEANGGYIAVKSDGEVLAYFLYDRVQFEQYLLDNTIFERASTSKHDFAYLYKENNKMYMKLNLDIRFKDNH